MVFNTTFNHISVISLAVSCIGGGNVVTGENRHPVASDWQTLSHNVVSSTPHHDSFIAREQNRYRY